MAREPKNYDHLIGKIKGLSENQLKAHFTLYQGYVKKLNEIEQKLGTVDKSAPNYSYNDYSELKRREPVAYNGTFLHEAYFDNLGGEGTTPPEALKKACTESFGSWDNYITDVRAAAGSAHGWVLTVYGYADMKVRNVLVQSEHHVGLFMDTAVLVAVDVWEHAYFMDYGTKKPDYLTSVINGLNWDAIGKRVAWTPLEKPHPDLGK
jgi:superoxide dismutase, Fe-Mn family